jgi:galactonate dehydratase
MKISKLDSFFVKPRWHFLKITTDDGFTGWGEPIIEGRARTVAMAIKELEPVLLGRNPLEIEALWTEM